MKPAEQWRLGLAQYLAQFYTSRPDVVMVLLGGSMAQGTADAYSDMDLFVYWGGATLDVDALTRTAGLKAVTGERLAEQWVWERRAFLEQYTLGHLRVEVEHITLAQWERAAAEVTEQLRPIAATQCRLAGFLTAHVLSGEALYRPIRERLAVYPAALAERAVAEALDISALWQLSEQSLARQAWPSFYVALNGLLQHSVAALAGLNHRYLPTETLKWLRHWVNELPICPPDSAERLTHLFAITPQEAGAALEIYLDELITLVEQQLPNVDTRPVRRLLNLEEPNA